MIFLLLPLSCLGLVRMELWQTGPAVRFQGEKGECRIEGDSKPRLIKGGIIAYHLLRILINPVQILECNIISSLYLIKGGSHTKTPVHIKHYLILQIICK